MVSSTFFIVLCGILFVTAEGLRFRNRIGPDDRNEFDGGDDGDQQDGREIGSWGGRGGRHGHGRGGRLPFLANATEEERKQFFAIFKDRSLDRAAKEQAIEKLIATLDPAIGEAYNEWKKERDAKLAEKVAALSPEARKAYDERQAIENDATLSAEDKRTKLRDFDRNLRNLPDEVRRELRRLMWEGFGGDRRGDKFGGGRHQLPSFLSNISDPTIIEQFKTIFEDRSLDRAAKEQAIEKLISTLDPAIGEAYNEWKAEKDARFAEKLAKLSPEARKIYDDRKAIEDNASLSSEEKKKQIEEMMKPLTPEIRRELMKLFGDHRGGRGDRRGGRGRGDRRGDD